jgi:hypothetical protein
MDKAVNARPFAPAAGMPHACILQNVYPQLDIARLIT